MAGSSNEDTRPMRMQYYMIDLVFEPLYNQIEEGIPRNRARQLVNFVARMLADHPRQLDRLVQDAELIRPGSFWQYFRSVWGQSIPPLYFDELESEEESPPPQLVSPPIIEESQDASLPTQEVSPPVNGELVTENALLPSTVSLGESASESNLPPPEPMPPVPSASSASPNIVSDGQIPGRSDGRSPLGLFYRIPQDNISDDEMRASPIPSTPPKVELSSPDDSSDGLSPLLNRMVAKGHFAARDVSPTSSWSPDLRSDHSEDDQWIQVPEGALEKRTCNPEVIPEEEWTDVDFDSEYQPNSDEEETSDDSLFEPVLRSRRQASNDDGVFGHDDLLPPPELVQRPFHRVSLPLKSVGVRISADDMAAANALLPLASRPPEQVSSSSSPAPAAKKAPLQKRKTAPKGANRKTRIARESPPPQLVEDETQSPPPQEVYSPAPQRVQKKKRQRKQPIVQTESDEDNQSPSPQLVRSPTRRVPSSKRQGGVKMYNVKKNRFVEQLRRENAQEVEPRPAPDVTSRVPYKPEKRSKTGRKQNRKKGGPFRCDYCQKEFGIHYNLTKHVREKHMHPTIYTCGTCGRAYTRQESFRYHMSTIHAAPGTFGYKCELCGQRFVNRFGKRYHMKTVHRQPTREGDEESTEEDSE